MMLEKLDIVDLKENLKYIDEVATLEYYEWANNPTVNSKNRIINKVEKIKQKLDEKNFVKLLLIRNNYLIGFISIFPYDSDDYPNLTPWYATMYVKQKERGKGYSKILNDAILKRAKDMGIKTLYLKTTLDNYYEKFGAIFIETKNQEKLYKFVL